jgi:Type IV secretion-system coupling protein DNA-binding domain
MPGASPLMAWPGRSPLDPVDGGAYERRLRAAAESIAITPSCRGAFLEQYLGDELATLFLPGSVRLSQVTTPAWMRARDRCRYFALVPEPSIETTLALPPTPEETNAWEEGRSLGKAVLQAHWLFGETGRIALRVRLAADLSSGGAPITDAVVRGAVARLRWITRHRFTAVDLAPTRAMRREFETGKLAVAQAGPPVLLAASVAARAVAAFRPLPSVSSGDAPHTVVLGASGTGKTTYLAARAAAAIDRGESVVAIDVHGDLAPAIARRLDPGARGRLVALDPTTVEGRSVGVRIVTDRARPGAERAAAQLVAALRRLSSENGETYWGYRLERLFDAFVRIVQSEGGDLVDLYALFTDERRRDAARLATRDPETARFLDELAVLLRRTPDLLWPAASRLAKVAAEGPLRALLAPDGSSVDLDQALAEGRSVIARAPIGEFGPEGSSFAATLLVGRLYLALTGRCSAPPADRPTLLVVDEAHAVAPRLLAEVLAEGRKFGVDVLLATQYAERLAPELRAAALGSAGCHVIFRTPRGGATAGGAWVGLGMEASIALLPQLPFGEAVVSRPDDPLGLRVARLVPAPVGSTSAWPEMVAATVAESGEVGPADARTPLRDERMERFLLAVFGLREGQAGRVDLRSVIARVVRDDALALDPASVLATARHAQQRGWTDGPDDDLVLTESGARFLGAGGATGAVSETAEHRALLLEVFRRFARHGEKLEIVRQGRFDRRLPDARCRVLAEGGRSLVPAALARYLKQRERSWLWRCFGGRDVHVEAEVSGALRADRIRRGVEKARSAGAFALFVAADPRLARRIRVVLHEDGLVPASAQVWTLPGARAARPPERGSEADEP